MKPILILSTLLLVPLSLAPAADLKLAAVFSDHMVLQRDKPLPVWGWADPGEQITLTFAGQTQTTTADDHGQWKVNLKAMPAKLVSDDGAHVVIRPLVLVGEDEARQYAKECELPIIGCCCPACGDLGLQRQRVKKLLMELELEHPGVKASMLKALGNVAPRHLLDTRLNPPAELRAKVGGLALAEATAS